MRISSAFLIATVLGAVLAACPNGPGDPGGSSRFDPMPDADDTRVFAGFAPLGRWNKDELTYFLAMATNDISTDAQRQVFETAIALWRDRTTLDFTEVSRADQADMIIGFGFDTHCTLYELSFDNDLCIVDAAFDGSGGILAHCYFPNQGELSGDCHFDDAEVFTADTTSTTAIRLLEVALHELGHGLGLDHSNDTSAIMFPSYRSDSPKLALGQEDIDRIQALYGSRDGVVLPAARVTLADPRYEDVPREPGAPDPGVDDDGDMLSNSVELYMTATDPNDADTDDDGLTDYEVVFGFNPLNADSDGDGISDGDEMAMNTNPFFPDPDGEGGAPTQFVGDYAGTTENGAGLTFTIRGDGTVTGELALQRYGTVITFNLGGIADGTGLVELIALDDRFYVLDGTIMEGVATGTVYTMAGAELGWSANFVLPPDDDDDDGDNDGFDAEKHMNPNGDGDRDHPVPGGKSAFVHPIHRRVDWRATR